MSVFITEDQHPAVSVYDLFRILEIEIRARYLDGKYVPGVVHIECVYAFHPGQGAFRRLFAHLQATYPGAPIIVGEVSSRRFRDGLGRLGFRHLEGNDYIHESSPANPS